MKKCYSYARFSSVGQKDGSSIERQMEIAVGVHRRLYSDLPLDTGTYKDLGLSAYKGDHVEKGSLGLFLQAIRDGAVEPGSVLICENLDRVSRQGPKAGRKIIEKIVDAGVTVHINNIDTILTMNWENDYRRYPVDSELERAWKESQYKVDRIGRGWARVKEEMRNGQRAIKHCPEWLRAEGNEYVEIPEKVALVRKIFELRSQGLGSKRIKEALNGEGANLTMNWILKTLSNKAVLGQMQTMKKVDGVRVNDGDMAMRFPQIIDAELWKSARASVDAANRMDGKRRNGRRSAQDQNLFSGLLFDVTNDDVTYQANLGVWYVKKNDKEIHLVTNTAKAGAGNIHRIKYSFFEQAFKMFLHRLDWRKIVSSGTPDSLKELLKEETELRNKVHADDETIASRQNRLDAADVTSDAWEAMAASLGRFQKEAATRKAELSTLELKVDAERSKVANLDNFDVLLRLLEEGDPETRLKTKSEIAKAIKRINLSWHWGGELLAFNIIFVNCYESEYVEMYTKTGEILAVATQTGGLTYA